jgi:DNA primase
MSDVDEIKQRVDIVDVVAQHVALKRAGRNFMGLCPFHAEKTPSFHVDPGRQSWHCFGACGTGGDVFSFVMKRENVDFRDALRMLAERAGIALNQRRDTREDARRARLYEINEDAAEFFARTLAVESGEHAGGAAVARAYIDERRIAADAIARFQVGYAPNSWEALSTHLQSRGYKEAEVVAAGLAVDGDRGAYDRFRHRLMFPIREERGRVAGFGGRLLPGDALGAGDTQPKYVNTSQSAIFDKGAILYGLDLAKDAIRVRDRVVIVEGYMDAMAAHEHGYENVVASMGTALTERQVSLLKRHTRNLVMALDADAAGSEATVRGVQVVAGAVDREYTPQVNWRGVIRMQETLSADIRVVTMPVGRDPDDVIRADAASWEQLVAEAKPVLDYLFEASVAKHDLGAPRERSAVTAELLPMIAAVPDRVVQSHYLQRLGRMAQVDEETLRQEMKRPLAASGVRQGAVAGRSPAAVSQIRDKREEFCLALLFRYPEARDEGMAIDADLFVQSENRALFETWISCGAPGEPFEESLPPDLRPHYERILQLDLPAFDAEASAAALRSTVWGIEQQRLRLAKRASAAVLADMDGVRQGAEVAKRAREAWQAGADPQTTGDEADPAAAFVEDMEAGLKVHQRLLEQRRAAYRGGE